MDKKMQRDRARITRKKEKTQWEGEKAMGGKENATEGSERMIWTRERMRAMRAIA